MLILKKIKKIAKKVNAIALATLLAVGGLLVGFTPKTNFQAPTHYNNAPSGQPTNWVPIPSGQKVQSCDNANRDCTGTLVDGEVEPTSQRGFATLAPIE